jgi:hypothetical protein
VDAKFYRFTESGQKLLATEVQTWTRVAEAVSLLLRSAE